MAPKTWNTSSPAAEEVSRRSSRLTRWAPRALRVSTVSSSSLRHVSPLGWDHIVLTGDYDWNSGTDERSNVRPLNLYPAKIRA